MQYIYSFMYKYSVDRTNIQIKYESCIQKLDSNVYGIRVCIETLFVETE